MPLRRPGLKLWALAWSTTGCAQNLSGSWEGRCAFNDHAQGYESPVELDITDGRGAILSGTVELLMYDDQVFTGDLDGQRNGDWVQLDSSFRDSADQVYTFQIEGDTAGVGIAGECRLTVPNGSGALVGEVHLVQ